MVTLCDKDNWNNIISKMDTASPSSMMDICDYIGQNVTDCCTTWAPNYPDTADNFCYVWKDSRYHLAVIHCNMTNTFASPYVRHDFTVFD